MSSSTSSSDSDKILAAATYGTIMGRHIRDGDGTSVKFDWPGIRITFEQVTGTTSIRLRKTCGSVLGYSVTQQGKTPEEKIVPTNILNQLLSKDILLASDLDPTKLYQVSIWKRDDPELCHVSGLVVDDTATAATPSDEKKKTHIEFVGDADVVGFGNMGAMTGMTRYLFLQSWTKPIMTDVQNATDASKSWAAHVAAGMENANYSIIAWSARGAKYSPPLMGNMISLYSNVLATDNGTANGDLGIADAVVVSIGHDDMFTLGDRGELSDEALMQAFEELLQVIRKHRPAPIPIIAISPAMDAVVSRAVSETTRKEKCVRLGRVWKALICKMGGSSAEYHLVENHHQPQIELNSKNDFGTCLHWNAASHKKWADGMLPSIVKIVNGDSK